MFQYHIPTNSQLVCGFNPIEKYAPQMGSSSPHFRGEHKNIFEIPLPPLQWKRFRPRNRAFNMTLLQSVFQVYHFTSNHPFLPPASLLPSPRYVMVIYLSRRLFQLGIISKPWMIQVTANKARVQWPKWGVNNSTYRGLTPHVAVL